MGKKRKEDKGPGVPTWIVSFSDMITLLLAFFVLLQTFAKNRDPSLFYDGQGSFRRAIAGMGVPDWLFGKPDHPAYENPRIRHPTKEDPDNPADAPVRNVRDEEIRQRFEEIKENIEHEITDVKERVVALEAMAIEFEGRSAAVDAAHADRLRQFARALKQGQAGRSISIHVIGLAADESDPKGQFLASARRAAAVETILREELLSQVAPGTWQLNAWGAAQGKTWRQYVRTGAQSAKTNVLIAVMGTGEDDGGG